jgi:hypothetical protein
MDDGARRGSSWNSSIFWTIHWLCHGPHGGQQNDETRIRGSPRARRDCFWPQERKEEKMWQKFTRSQTRANASFWQSNAIVLV